MSAAVDLIHIGYQKSASTLLQRSVFATHADIHLVEPKALTRRIVFHDDNDLDIEAIRGLARDGLDDARVNLYSDEGLSGWGFHFNYARLARRLHAIFPDAKIIIIIRNQIGFLESLYRHKLHFGYGFTPERFVNTYCRHHNVLHGIQFSRVIAEYRNLFENVFVELMERLTSPAHAAACLTRLCSFAGVDSEPLDPATLTPVNVGMSPLSVSLTRVLNRVSATKVQGFDNARIYNLWRYRWSRRIDAVSRLVGLKDTFEFPERLKESIREHFEVDNELLSDMFEFDIRAFGYDF